MTTAKPIVKNWQQIKLIAIEAAESYLQGKKVWGDSLLYNHGATGKHRAKMLIQYLKLAQNEATILAILLAVFDKPEAGLFGWVPGRSHRLAGLIASDLMTGATEKISSQPLLSANGNHAIQFCPVTDLLQHFAGNKLTSTAFSESSLQSLEAEMSMDDQRIAPDEEWALGYFDKTKAVRCLLEKTLQQMSRDYNDPNLIVTVAEKSRKIKAALEDNKAKDPILKDFQIEIDLLSGPSNSLNLPGAARPIKPSKSSR